MIERDNFNCLLFSCDDCGEQFHSGEENFTAALRVVKDQKWKNEKVGEEWWHTCPDCNDLETIKEFE